MRSALDLQGPQRSHAVEALLWAVALFERHPWKPTRKASVLDVTAWAQKRLERKGK